MHKCVNDNNKKLFSKQFIIIVWDALYFPKLWHMLPNPDANFILILLCHWKFNKVHRYIDLIRCCKDDLKFVLFPRPRCHRVRFPHFVGAAVPKILPTLVWKCHWIQFVVFWMVKPEGIHFPQGDLRFHSVWCLTSSGKQSNSNFSASYTTGTDAAIWIPHWPEGLNLAPRANRM